MKTTIALVGCILLSAAAGMAQTRVGILGGLNLADLEESQTSTPTTFSGRNGMAFGGVLELKLGDNLGLRIEPTYIQKGGSQDFAPGDVIDTDPGEASFELDYVDVPAVLMLGLGTGDTRPFALLGACLSFNTGASLRVSSGATSAEADLGDGLKSTDFGLVFGGGFEIPVAAAKFVVEIRHVLGLSNIIESQTVQIDVEPFQIDGSIKSTGTAIMAGFLLPVGGR